MPKSGLFAGEATQNAPANGAVTDKPKGYHWMEWREPVVQSTLLNGLIGYWALNEWSGQTRVSAIGGADFIPENQFEALSTDGVKGRAVKCGGGSAADDPYKADGTEFNFLDTSWFISLWVMDLEETGSRVAMGDWINSTTPDGSWLIKNWGSSPFGWQFSVTGPNGTTELTGTEAGVFNNFAHLVIWHDAENDQIGMTLNDQAVPDTAVHIGGLDPNNVLGLGWAATQSVYFGNIDEVGIWNRVPTAAEITELYNAGNGVTYPFDGIPPVIPPYDPEMMTYDEGYYSNTGFTPTTAGNKVTVVARFKLGAFTGTERTMFRLRAGSSGFTRYRINVYSDDDANVSRRGKLEVQAFDSSGAKRFSVWSINTVNDDQKHVVFASLDTDTGNETFVIDGVVATDTGNPEHAGATIFTLPAGPTSDMSIGTNLFGSFWADDLGYFGYDDQYLTDYTDFMTGSEPKELDETSWAQWNNMQPAVWNKYGKADDNKGNTGNATVNGTITGPA